MPASKQKPSLSKTHKKRHGHHHHKGKQYGKVYWPYIPLLALILIGIGFTLPASSTGNTLAFATDVTKQSMLSATNEQRLKDGDTALSLNDKLARAAQAKANDMAARDYWSHITPDGEEPWKFIDEQGYEYMKAGENLAYGFTTTSDTIKGWMNSPTHRANMLDGTYSEVGFGFVNADRYQRQDNETIIVAMYALPADSTLAVAHGQTAAYESNSYPISKLQTMATAIPGWLTFSIGLMSGLAITYLFLVHAIALRRLVLKGERFVLHHPLFDLLLLGVIIFGLLLGRTVGHII